jgi:hypothetical protein
MKDVIIEIKRLTPLNASIETDGDVLLIMMFLY